MMDAIAIGRRTISVAAAYRWLDGGDAGGIVLFAGRVRPDRTPNGRVVALDYEADRAMAERALRRIAAEARRRYGASRILAWHRTGRVRAGDVSVVVGAAAPHRSAAFAASRFVIDRLKTEAPLWKRDVTRGRPRARRLPRA